MGKQIGKPMQKQYEVRKKEALEKKDTLESVLDSIENDSTITDVEKKFKERFKKEAEEITFTDYTKIQEDCDYDSDQLVNSMAYYYLSPDFLENAYIKNKIAADIIVVSKIFFQLKVAENAVKKFMEKIDKGDFNGNDINGLSGLMRTQMEIAKHQIQINVVLENNYKHMEEENNEKQKLLSSSKPFELPDGNEPKIIQGVGTKTMIQKMVGGL